LYEKLKGNFFDAILSQNGSIELQKALKSTNSKILSKIFEEVKHNLLIKILNKIPELIIDKYGNYFCQKLFKYIESEERIRFLEIVLNY
jgi:hypothetical protein